MNSLYSNGIREFIYSQPWPRRLTWTTVEWHDSSCIKVVLIRESINELDTEDKLHLANMMSKMLHNIQDRGVPIYTWVMTLEEYRWRDRPEGFYTGDKKDG